jgi:hypothetical protein
MAMAVGLAGLIDRELLAGGEDEKPHPALGLLEDRAAIHAFLAQLGEGRCDVIVLVPNLFGDGILRAVGVNHTNTNSDPMADESAVYALTPPTDRSQP